LLAAKDIVAKKKIENRRHRSIRITRAGVLLIPHMKPHFAVWNRDHGGLRVTHSLSDLRVASFDRVYAMTVETILRFQI